MSGGVTVRFAPSPTGRLHVGNLRLALINWLFARKAGGEFLLRLDDTDAERSRADHAAAIEQDLAWLGLDWDRMARQSERLAHYTAAAERLTAAGRLYPCYETAEELAFKRRAAQRQGRPPIYNRAALALGAGERAALEVDGRRPHWRFRLADGAIEWDDLVRGPQHFEAVNLSDPILVREDGRPLYTLSSVVDDVAFAISHVLRGEDHVANTAVQIQLFEALGGALPRFGHLSLLVAADGSPLSKRLGSLSLARLREQGLEPMAIASYLARLGTADPIVAETALEALVAGFDLARFGRAAPKFDPAELGHLNARVLHAMPFDLVRARLLEGGLAAATAAFWEVVRANLARFDEVREWYAVCYGAIEPVIEDPGFAAAAAELLPPEPWDETTWGDWTAAVKVASGRKGKALYRPLRLALTGRSDGPELQSLLPLIGRARALERLRGHNA